MSERWVETGTDCYIDQSSSLDHSSTSFASWLGSLSCGSLKAQPSASWFSLWYSCLNWLMAAGTLSIFFLNAYLVFLLFGLFTQVHLLIDGSVEGQYITLGVQLARFYRQLAHFELAFVKEFIYYTVTQKLFSCLSFFINGIIFQINKIFIKLYFQLIRLRIYWLCHLLGVRRGS